MIHVVRQKEPNFPPDAGHARTTIGRWVVDWSGVMPTITEVSDFINPPSAAVAAAERSRVKDEIVNGKHPLARAIRALLRITKPSDRTAAQWRQEFLAAIDADA